ncbi:thermonuclease family protein [Mesorhizobium sp.]|uniref:thermonuclease family protein n=2 Tax=Mesorhizobium sp. TaxID=1871066 RepID=UPI000FE69136|nr:MAG: hypothetical protein EOR01_22260 [Mesorhizobium sp.]RWQ26820.1 MAG: hypothetical protein EOS19_23410 [Mesorhizobium sp.]
MEKKAGPPTRSANEKSNPHVVKRRMAELLASGPVTVRSGDPDSGRLKDRYGRTLATIEVNGNVGKIMIAEGLARPWTGKRRPWYD